MLGSAPENALFLMTSLNQGIDQCEYFMVGHSIFQSRYEPEAGMQR
jgi:hypothetical protein